MRFDVKTFLNKAVGDDFLETLSKTELYKPNANIAIDLDDIRIGLKVVPRIIMSMLIRELPPMKIGEAKSIPLLLGKNALMNVNKHDTDTYSGSISDDGKQVVNFKFRPLPGVGLVIMSAFELYELEDIKEEPKQQFVQSAEQNVQKLIDERLAMHSMVSQVVEKKLMEREAIQQLFMSKIKEIMQESKPAIAPVSPVATPQHEDKELPSEMKEALTASEMTIDDKELKPVGNVRKSIKKESPLKDFLYRKESKKNNEFEFKVIKSEVSCPDCKQDIFKNEIYHGCICMGSDMDNKVFIKKNEDGVKIRFPKSWDKDNIELLLDLLRKKNG